MIEKILIKIEENFNDPFPDEDLKNFILKPSKRIRSKIAILYFSALGYEINNDVIQILSAGEIIHNASLLHDDVLDNAPTRRGETTIAQKHSPHISILAGDYLVSLAIDKLLNINSKEILNNFKTCIQKMTASEIKQYFLRGKIPTLAEYLEICEGKTAALFETIFENCAIILNANIETSKKFAKIFGIVFQVKNDLEKESAHVDELNKIYTAKDILGIEKTTSLLDNYKEEMREILKGVPENKYKQELEDLL